MFKNKAQQANDASVEHMKHMKQIEISIAITQKTIIEREKIRKKQIQIPIAVEEAKII